MRNLLAKAQRIGVAIAPDRATVVLAGTGISASVTWQLDADDTASVAALFVELKGALATAAGRLLGKATIDIALAPPLAEVRLLTLPPLRPHEALAVLKRDASRYFVAGNGHRALAVRLPRRRGNAPQPALAASASANFIEQLYVSAAAAGWQVRTVVPALAAWSAATTRGKGAPRLIAAQIGDVIHALRIDAAPTQLRRVPLDSIAEVRDAAGAGPGRAWLWTTPDVKADLEAALSGGGWQVQETSFDALVVAAQFAGEADIELLPESRAQLRAAHQRALALQLAAAAAVLLTGAAGLELWGEQRELAALRAQRAAIRTEVGPLLAVRDSTNQVNDRIKRIDELRAGSSHLTAALIDLATLLPSNTYITAVHANGDSLVVEAAGAQAGGALQALRTSEVLTDIRLRGSVDRRMEEGAVTNERFTFTARVAPRPLVATPPPVRSARPVRRGSL
jgi:Tfp pilus assembly protein PilN